VTIAVRAAIAALLLACGGVEALAAPRDAKAGTFGAIAYHRGGGEWGWATDRRTSRDAGAEALRQCAHPRCEVVITVRNACAALARGPQQWKTSKGVTRGDAEAKALARCGAGCEVVAWTCTK